MYIAILLCMNFVSGIPQIKTDEYAINGIKGDDVIYNDKSSCFLIFNGKRIEKECIQEIRPCFFTKEAFVCLK